MAVAGAACGGVVVAVAGGVAGVDDDDADVVVAVAGRPEVREVEAAAHDSWLAAAMHSRCMKMMV